MNSNKDLIHRLRSVGEPGALKDMCVHASNELEKMQEEIDVLVSENKKLVDLSTMIFDVFLSWKNRIDLHL